jgi:hypothetical protein
MTGHAIVARVRALRYLWPYYRLVRTSAYITGNRRYLRSAWMLSKWRASDA